MKMNMRKIAAYLMIFRLLRSGNFAPWRRGKRNSGIQDISVNERRFTMRTGLWAVIVCSMLLAIVALMCGCTSKGGSVMSMHFGFAPTGVEIDFALSVPDAEVLSSPPTSQPSSESGSVE